MASAALRGVFRLLVVAGLLALVGIIDRAALWGPVAAALVLASGLVVAGAFAARLHRSLRQRLLLGCSLADLDRMSGPAFEDWVVRRLVRSGFACTNLPRSHDYGIDAIAIRGARRIGVQAKRYDGPVGNGAVQQAIAGAGHHGCPLAAVVTQSRFTPAARAQAAAATIPVLLVDRTGLADVGRVLRRGALPARAARSGQGESAGATFARLTPIHGSGRPRARGRMRA